MAELQKKIDELGSEVDRWEKELQALQEIVGKTKEACEKLHKRGLDGLVFKGILSVVRNSDEMEECFVKKIGAFLNGMSTFRDELTKFQDDMKASYEDCEKIYQSIPPINTKFQDLQKLEASLQEGLKLFQEEVQADYERWKEEYSDITSTRDRFRAVLNELEVEESMPSTQDAEAIDKDVEKIKEAVNGLELVSFVSQESALRGQLTTTQAKIDGLCSPWDSALTDLIKRLAEKEKWLEQKPAKLERFVQERGLELIWPEQGDRYLQEDHRILDEREDSQVSRGQVIQPVVPGLRRGTDVLVKAGIWLAK